MFKDSLTLRIEIPKATRALARMVAFFILASFYLIPDSALAQTYQTWRGENTQNSWQDANAWWNFPNNSPIVFGQQEWDNNVELSQSNNNGGTTLSTWRWLYKSGASSSHTFSGDAVRFFDYATQDPSITNQSAATHFINMNVQGDGEAADPLKIQIDNNSGGGLTFNGTVNNQGSDIHVIGTASSAATVRFNGVISGSAGFYKENSNIVALFDAANTYTGQLTIQAGTVRLNDTGDTFGASTQDIRLHSTGVLDLNGVSTTVGSVAEYANANSGNITLGVGTLTIAGADKGTFYQSSISGTGGLTMAGSGNTIMSLFGTQSYTGTTTVSSGSLTTASAMSSTAYILSGGNFSTQATNQITDAATLTVNSGTFTLGGADTMGAISGSGGTININGSYALTTSSSSSTTYSGVIAGTGGLTKNGTGTLTLSGANTYTGTTTINAGALRASNATSLGTTAAGTTVASGAALELSGGISIGAEALTLSGTGISDGGALRNISGDNTYAGLITLGAATRINSDSGNLTISNAGTITGSGFGLTIVGSGNTSISSIIGIGGGTLTKNGTGTLTLSGTNTYTGGTDITLGKVVITNNSSLGGAGGGLVRLGLFAGASNTRVLEFGADGITLTNTSGIQIQNASGTSTIRLDLAGTNSGAISGQINITRNTDGFVVDVGDSDTLNFNGNIVGGGTAGITKSGAGTLTINGTNTNAGPTTINAGTLTLNGGNAIPNTGAVILANATSTALNVNASETIGNLSGGGTLGGNIAIAASQTLTVNQTTGQTYAGAISGAGGLTKNGSSTLTLSGANSYTGATTINAGTISLGANNNIIGDSSDVIISGGNLTMTTNTETVRSFTMSSGGLEKNGGGTLTASQASTLSGGTVSLTTGTMTFAADTQFTGAQVNIVSGASVVLNTGSNATFNGSNVLISGTAGKINTTDTLNLGTTNFAYNNASAATQGIILGGNISVSSGVTSSFTNNTTGIGRISLGGSAKVFEVGSSSNMNVGWVIDATNSSGTLTKNGTGTLTLSGANTYSGTTTLNNGQININNNSALGTGAFTINGGTIDSTTAGITLSNNTQNWNGDFTFAGSNSLNLGTGAVAMNATRTVTVTANTLTLTVGGAISGATFGLTKAGAGTLTLSGVNTYNGTTTVSAGTLTLGSSDRIANTSNLNVSGGTFNLGGNNETLGSITGSGNITLGAGTLTTNSSSSTTFSGNITGASGALTKEGSGTLTLSGTNTYSGATTINAGTLTISGNTSSSAISIASGGTLNASGTAGTTTVNSGGTLMGSGTVGATTVNGIIAPGNSPGILTVGDLTLNSGGTYIWEMADATGVAGTGWDQIVSTGLLTVASTSGATFTINITSSGSPTNWSKESGFTWDLIDYGTISGFAANKFTLNTANFAGSTDAGSSWVLSDTGSVLRLTYSYTSGTPTWSGGAGNWSTGFTPAIANGLSAIFDGAAGGTATNNIVSATLASIGSLTFNSTAGAYTLAANSDASGFNAASALAIGGNITNSSTATQTLNIATSFAASQTVNATAGNIILGGAVSVASGQTLTLLGNITISGNASGAGSFSKTGTGTLTLSGSSSLGGGVEASAGTLLLGHNHALGTGNFTTTGSVTIASTDSTARVLETSYTSLSGGGVTITFGQASGGTGALTFNGTSGLSIGSGSRTLQVLNTTTLMGGITGSGDIIKTGAGTLVLAGANTYTGTTTLNAGVLQIGNGGTTGALSTSSAITNNGTLVFNRSNTITQGTDFHTVIGGSGALTQNGSGTLTLSGANTYSGTTTLNAGTIQIGHANGLGTSGNISFGGGALQYGVGITQDLSSRIKNSGSAILVDTNGNSVTFASVVDSTNSGGFTKNGSGTLTLTAANTYTGATTINTGTLAIGSGSTSGSLDSSSAITNNAVLVFNRSDDLTVSNTITGTGNLTKSGAGTLTLSGASSSYSGTTTLSAGTIQIGHANGLGTGGNITFSGGGLKYGTGITEDLSSRIKNSGSAILVDTNGESVTWGTALGSTNSGTLTKNGTGTLTLSANATYTGGTTVNGGTLEFTDGTASAIGNGTITINNGSTLSLNKSQFNNQSIIFGSSGGGNLTTAYNGIRFSGSTIYTTGGSTNFISGSTIDIHIPTFNVAEGTDDVDLQVSNFIQRGGITKSGAGKLLLTANNNLVTAGVPHPITINAGALEIGASGRLVSGSFSGNMTNNGIFIYSGANAQTLSGIISGSGALTQNAASTLTLSGNNTYTGTTTINAGAIVIGAAGRLGAGSYAQNISNNGTLIYSGTNDQTLSGVISGTGALTKNAASTLTLTNDNTYSGATTINVGTLQIGNGLTAGSLNATSAITVNGTLVFNRSNTVTQGTDFNSVISGSGAVTQNGSGTLALSGANNYNGATTINTGIIRASNATALGTTADGVTVASGAALELIGGITIGAEALNLSGTGISTGGALRNISGDNTYGGAITLAAAARINSDAGLLTLSGAIGGAGQNLTIGGAGNTTISNAIGTTTGTLTKADAGTLTLSGANTFSGGITLSAGTLHLQNASGAGSGTLTQSSGVSLLLIDTTGTISNDLSVYNVQANQSTTLSGAITVNNATFDVETGDTLTLSGGVGGSGGVTKNGTGSLVLSGSNTYSGVTAVNSGTLNANHANALGNTANITVNGGSLLVSADDAINGKDIKLASTASGNGTAASLVFSGTYNGTAGTLTLNQDSIIDLGTGSVVVHFADLFMSTYTLSIYNWTGTTLWNGGDGNNTDQFYIDRSVSGSELNNISFYSGFDNSSFVGTGYQLSGGSFNQQIIPVPEPETWATGILLVLSSGLWLWRKRTQAA